MTTPVYIVEVMREIVQSVSTAITTQLQTTEATITGVHYEHGHVIEIVETLAQKDQSNNYKFDKYPLIGLFQDFPEAVDQQAGNINEATLHVIIAKSTVPDYKAKERYQHNFYPFLYPIYWEFIKQIKRHKSYAGGYQLPHEKTDRLYWGREGLFKNDANIFGDWIDCIEIRDLKIKFNAFKC